MSYIQRLLDSASPMTAPLSAPKAGSGLARLTPALTITSPLMGADQRLGLFPDLSDPFAADLSGPLPAPSALPDIAPPPPVADPAPRVAPMPQPEAMAPTPSRSPVPQAEVPPLAPPDPMPPRPVSALQRLVELDPLPAPPHTCAGPRIVPTLRVTETRSGRVEALIPPPPPAAIPNPAPAPLTPRNPFLITPDQFQPVERPQPVAAAPPLPVRVASIPLAPPGLVPQPPLQPAADAGPSPFARAKDLPPSLPPALPATIAAPPPPKAPPATPRARPEPPRNPAPQPKAMTAAAQSVIGPLDQRPAWHPRQEGV